MNYPVFIHHEGNQPYLHACLEQACLTNENVILIGDVSNKDSTVSCPQHLHICSIDDQLSGMRFDTFMQYYEHMTFYDIHWCKQFFKRLFFIEAYLQEHKYPGFFMLDSDILCYCNLSDLDFVERCDAAFCIPQQTYEELRWVANLGVSFYTAEALTDMLNFFIDEFKNNKAELMVKWEKHLREKLPGGICEMSLAYLWTYRTKFRVENIAKLQGAEEKWCINNSLLRTQGYYENEYKMDKLSGILKLRFVNKNDVKVPELFNENIGMWIPAKTLHFHGASKRLMCFVQKTPQKICSRCYSFALCSNAWSILSEICEEFY